MKFMKFTYIFFLLTIGFVACKKEEDVILPFQQTMDIAYGTDAQQKFDAYLPEGRTSDTPVLIFVHGGSWTSGDKSQYSLIMTYFTDRKIAAFNVNYRLATATGNKNPAQTQDIQSLVSFIKQKASEYHISSSKFVIAGHSAGAHLALMTAYKYNTDGQLKAVAALAPPTDFVEAGQSNLPEFTQTIEFFLGKSYAADMKLWESTSPYYAVATTSVPTILFHGQKDTTVPVSQSIKLKAKLDQLGVKSSMVLYPNEEHIWLNDNLQDTLTKMVDWITTYTK